MLSDSGRVRIVEEVGVLEDLVIHARQHIESIVETEVLFVPVAETSHKLRPFLIVCVGAAVYHPAPDLMTIFL